MEINANTRIPYKSREGKRSDTEDSRQAAIKTYC
jgi:hypothetical protein